MKLECTKKLLDFLGEKPGKGVADPDAGPLFSWTANLILLNRRKTIVITHAASHATFVLYGITAICINLFWKRILTVALQS